MTPHTRAAFQHSNLLVPSPPSLSELQRGLLDAHQWNGLDNDLLIGKDAGCPVHISMTPAGRGAAAAAFITQSIANVITCDGVHTKVALMLLSVSIELCHAVLWWYG